MRLKVIWCGLLLGLNGCSVDPLFTAPSHADDIPVGSEILLHKELIVSAETQELYVQNGTPLDYGTVDEHKPYCRLQLHRPSRQARTVPAGRWVIHRIHYNQNSLVQSHPLRLAGPDFHADGVPDQLLYVTNIRLRHAEIHEPVQLACAHWKDPAEAVYLTREQIARIVAPLMTLNIIAD